MDWDKLRVFKSVSDAGSFTHAGENLNLSQSAISRQISTLETSLGLKLFHRHARGLVLTERGEILYQVAEEVFDKLKQVETDLTDSRAHPEGPLSVTTVEFIASTWLVPQLGVFRDSYPKVQLTLLLDNRIYDLGRREADVAIRLHKANNNDLIERHMTKINFSLCASKTYLETAGSPKSPTDLINHVMIGYPQNMHTPFFKPNWIFSHLNIDLLHNPKVILINSMHSRHTAVKDGVGISVLPDYIAHQDDNLEVLFPELDIPSVDMYFIYPQERRNSKRIGIFKDFLFQNIKETYGGSG